MLKSAPAPSAEQLAEVDELLASAQRHVQERHDSFERCDSDGFISQWASGLSADRDRLQVQILKNGGHAEFWVLVDADGNVIADRVHWFQNQYSFAWQGSWKLPPEAEAKYGRRWIPFGDNSRIQKALKLHEEKRWFPAVAKIVGEGKGLSGAASCRAEAVRVFEEKQNA
jgi:hypothetical protein